MPPRLAERVAKWLLPPERADEMAGELEELFAHRVERDGRAAAARWYYRQLASFAWRFGALRFRAPPPETVSRDARHALRTFARSPGFTAVAVVTLALGIAANVAVLSIVRQVVTRPLGYFEEERLVRVWPEHHFTRSRFEAFREDAQSFEKFSAYVHNALTLTGEGAPEVVRVLEVSDGHFETFGVVPIHGRSLHASDTLPGAEAVVVLSHELWANRFGGSLDVLGSRVALDVGRTVVGVAPPGFRPRGQREDLWIPLLFDRDDDSYTHMANLGVAARLAPDATRQGAREELVALAENADPPIYTLDEVPTYTIAPYRDDLVGRVRPTLTLVVASTALVLVLCGVNLTNLLLARGVARRQELAVRAAMGARRGRLIQQLLTESTVLGLGAGAVGVGLVWWLGPWVLDQIREDLPRSSPVLLEPGMVVLGAVLSVVASVLVGLVPALRLSAADGGPQSGRASAGRASRRWSHGLVAVQIALALTVVASSGLLLKSFWRLRGVPTGFDPDNVISMRLSPSELDYPEEGRRRQYFEAVLSALEASPVVARAGAIQILPMTAGSMAVGYSPTGAPVPAGEAPPMASYRVVTPGYREALGVPLVEGRDLSESDRAGVEAVGLINERLARELSPASTAVGRTVRFENGEPWFRIVGVVADIHQHRLEDEARAEVYVPLAQDSWPSSMSIVARLDGDGSDRGFEELRAAVWSVDRNVAITRVQTMDAVVGRSMHGRRLRAVLFASFAFLSFVLSAVGVYGVTAHAVRGRTREIGIRMALGATRGRVVRETLLAGLRPVAAGLVLGVLVANLAARGLAGFLFEVRTTDPGIYGAVALLIGLVAVVAAYVPTRQAVAGSPVEMAAPDS